MLPLTDFVLGEIGRLNMPPSTQSAKVFIHNYPSGELFSIDDISTFTIDEKLDILTAVGNDGSFYMLEKTEEYNFSKAYHLLKEAPIKKPTNANELLKYIDEMERFLNGLKESGIEYKIFRRE